MSFNFGEVLTRAWQIVWKYKVLWIFGILAGCAESNGGGSSGSGVRGLDRRSGSYPLPPNMERALEQMSRWIEGNWWVLILIFVGVLLLVALFIFLGTVGRIGLIQGTLQAETGAERLAFGSLFSQSTPYFWRVFGLAFLVGLVFLALFVPLIFFGIFTAGVGFLCLIPLICLLIPVSLAVNLILEQAYIAIVKENLGITDGLQRGWDVVRMNLGPIILMGLILFGIEFVAGLVLAIPIFLIVFPAVFAYALGEGQSMTPTLVAGLCFVVYLPFLILARGILSTYTGSAWTLTYLRLTSSPQGEAPVVLEANA